MFALVKAFFMMKQKKQFLFVVMLLMVSICHAQQLIVVKDRVTLQPVSESIISLSKTPDFNFTTNKDGKITLNLPETIDTLTIKAKGYAAERILLADLRKQNYTIFLTELKFELNEVVVSATRFEEKKSDVPRQIMVLNAKELAFMNQQTTADVLQNSGNVFVQKSQLGGGSPVLRGFEANKVLIVVDGVRMNNAIFRGGHLQNIITLDNTMVDRAEVLFGAGSVVYGSDALGGVMNFYTKKPVLGTINKTLVQGNSFVRYSSANNEKTVHADVNIGLKKIAFLTGITYSDFDDLTQGANRNPFYGDWGKRIVYSERVNGKDSMISNKNPNVQKQSGYSQIDFLQKVYYKQNQYMNHTINFQYSTTSNINRYDRLTETSGGVLRNAEWYYGPQKRLLTSYTLNVKKYHLLFNECNVILSYQDIEESRHDRKFKNNTLNHRKEQVAVYAINADFEKKVGKHEIRYGVDIQYNNVTSTANAENIVTGVSSPLSTRYPDGGSTMQTIALFALHSWEISKKLILNNGTRFNHVQLNADFKDTTFYPFPFNSITQKPFAFVGNIGFSFMPGKDWHFTGLLSSGFRAPNVDDLAKVFDSKAGTIIVPNPNLKPEHTYNAEASISKMILNKVKLEGTAYYTIYRDALTTAKGTFNGQDSIVYSGANSAVRTTINAAEAYIYGYNLGLIADVTPAFSIQSTLNYTYGRIKTDTTDYPLDHIPPMFGKTGFTLKLKKFRGEFFALYQGWKKLKDYNLVGEDNQIYASTEGTPAWYTLNVRAAYYISKNLQLQLAIENITDNFYRTFASGISAPGRNVSITLRGRF